MNDNDMIYKEVLLDVTNEAVMKNKKFMFMFVIMKIPVYNALSN